MDNLRYFFFFPVLPRLLSYLVCYLTSVVSCFDEQAKILDKSPSESALVMAEQLNFLWLFCKTCFAGLLRSRIPVLCQELLIAPAKWGKPFTVLELEFELWV